MTTISPIKLGTRQTKALTALKAARTGLTAPQLRNELDFSPDSYGTRQAHALLRRLHELELVQREELSAKLADTHRAGTTGRKPTHRYKITADGKFALKHQA